MDSSRSQILLHAAISGRTETGLDSFSAGHPIERRLNRIERVVAAYRGKIEERLENALRVSFVSADAALLGACEMQHRCAVLPQLSGHALTLRIGIHRGFLCQRAKDQPDTTHEIATQLASLDDAILVSTDLADSLNSELQQLTRPISVANKIEMQVLQVDWRREIHPAAYGGESRWPASSISPRKTGGRTVLLHYGLKTIEISADHPVVTVGRDPQNDLVMIDDRVSRHHCRIERHEERVILVDESTNGTCVLTDDGAEFLVKNDSFSLKNKGMLFFGRASHGDRRGGVRFEFR